jgi:PleD family two-component response regulator
MGTVLIIDDDDAIRQLVGRALAQQHLVHLASDATSALAILATSKPDVIVCDVMMVT